MLDKKIRTLFRKGSRTYFHSSLFFPGPIRDEVSVLYGFVRQADNFVDTVPQRAKEFYSFRKEYAAALSGKKSRNAVIRSFVRLVRGKKIRTEWVRSFFSSMETDLKKKKYRTMGETLRYIYGSAEVIGLMMARIMNLDERSYPYARFLGRAMQYINFIRDIAEDLSLGRIYFPLEKLKRYGLNTLSPEESKNKPDAFQRLIRHLIREYEGWQSTAEKGFAFIPRSFLIPVRTASDMYRWTARKIKDDPFLIFKKKVKPSRMRILWTLIRHSVLPAA